MPDSVDRPAPLSTTTPPSATSLSSRSSPTPPPCITRATPLAIAARAWSGNDGDDKPGWARRSALACVRTTHYLSLVSGLLSGLPGGGRRGGAAGKEFLLKTAD